MEATIEMMEHGSIEEVEPLWDNKKCSECLGVGLTTLWRLRQHKGLPYVRVGSEIRYIPASVRAWVKSQEISKVD